MKIKSRFRLPRKLYDVKCYNEKAKQFIVTVVAYKLVKNDFQERKWNIHIERWK